MPDSLKEQRVLIVGASSGMGRETAILFAREGAKVMACARRENRLAELRREMEAEKREIGICAADASDPDAMERAAQAAVDQFGGIDVLVYATGTNTPDRALTRLNPEIWKMMVDVNLNGAYYATRAVLPGMRTRKSGLIFYISSRSAVIPDESGAAYQAAKRGLAGLAHAIRVEERANGIRTCVVCPGLTDTEILEKRLVKPLPETLAKALRAEDVAELILGIAKLPARAWVPEVHLFPALV
jgi:NADP-dependent 3-hydroxy acid dehydrogenase YdfG